MTLLREKKTLMHMQDRVVYRVGRSMFETERLPAPLVAHTLDLDEVRLTSIRLCHSLCQLWMRDIHALSRDRPCAVQDGRRMDVLPCDFELPPLWC